MKTMVLVLLTAVCLLAAACGRIYGPVEEVKTLINAKDDAILEISKKLEANPSEAGVDEARKAFEARKEDLKAKRKAVDDKPQSMNSDWMTMLFDSAANDRKYFQEIFTKFGVSCKGDCSAAQKKLSALEDDFYMAVKDK